MRRLAAKSDSNAGPIIEALRAAGCSVTIISAPGVPDLSVGRKDADGIPRTYWLEVKREAGPRGGVSGRKLTQEQLLWWAMWRGHAAIVRTPQEALDAVGL